MLIESDGMELAFRNKVAEWRNLGRYVDGQALERDGKRHVFVAPSPARAADPKGWVHQTVPLVMADPSVAKAAE
jgi:hypothetical protein